MSDLKVLFNPFRRRAVQSDGSFSLHGTQSGLDALESTGVGCEGICKIGQKDSIRAKHGRR